MRAAVDSLRPITPALWQRLDEPEQQRFLTSGARRWDRVRHRVEPTTGAFLGRRTATAGSSCTPARSRDVDGQDERRRWHVTISNGTRDTVLDVAAVVNCTGPRSDLSSDSDPLVLNLLTSGTAAPGRHHIGSPPTTRAGCWPWTARRRASGRSARCAAGSCGSPPRCPRSAPRPARSPPPSIAELPPAKLRRRPRDTYGLPLSATREAAASYNDAYARILRVQSGAPALMQQAVLSDPTFALGHATRALLGHEWGDASIDVAASIDTALRLIDTADERERRSSRSRPNGSSVPGHAPRVSLIAHIQAYPEDALAVSLAVPTIAFGGATELPQEAWALVEGLAPAYGEDWWYRGLLAFIRQEQ